MKKLWYHAFLHLTFNANWNAFSNKDVALASAKVF
jgi:hypothetical protein